MKVAKLVTAEITVRVVVDENSTEEEIIDSSIDSFIYIAQHNLSESVTEIENDYTCPYDPKFDGK